MNQQNNRAASHETVISTSSATSHWNACERMSPNLYLWQFRETQPCRINQWLKLSQGIVSRNRLKYKFADKPLKSLYQNEHSFQSDVVRELAFTKVSWNDAQKYESWNLNLPYYSKTVDAKRRLCCKSGILAQTSQIFVKYPVYLTDLDHQYAISSSVCFIFFYFFYLFKYFYVS